MDSNPYAPPKAPVVDAVDDEVSAASSPLFTIHQITVATFLGSGIAGAWLAASNFNAVNQPTKARKWIWIGIAATIAMLGISFLLPDRFPNFILPLAFAFGARAIATTEFGWILRDHEKAGGDLRSWWKAVGITLLVCAIVFAVAFAVMLAYQFATGAFSGE
jgi:O-antigen/teichoic acid export membrane protein